MFLDFQSELKYLKYGVPKLMNTKIKTKMLDETSVTFLLYSCTF